VPSSGAIRSRSSGLVKPSWVGRERQREAGEPAAEEAVDIVGPQRVADRLPPHGVVAGVQAIVERFEVYALGLELAFRPLVAVEADANAELDVRGELDEARGPVPVDDVEAVVVDHVGPVEVDGHARRAPAAALEGAEGAVVLLCHADEEHASRPRKRAR